jgi:Zn-dependent protease with chaperone function
MARRFCKCLLLLGLFAALAGCAANPMTGRSQLVLVSERMAISESALAYRSMMGQLGKKNKIEDDTERARKVREITDHLIAQAVRFRPDAAGWDWEVQLIHDPEVVNAFCMAGGKMAIYSGMWDKLGATDDEIAQVMGHEIGHALANHTQERMSIAMSSQVGAQIAAIALASRERQATAMAGAQMAALLAVQLPNGRTPQFLSTHPSPENRADRLKELAGRVEPLYLAARAAPLADAPKFLAVPGGGRNERVVAKPGESTREEFAARGATETLTFLAEPFERFRSGAARLECTAECALAYARAKGGWPALHAKAAWRDLAVSVMQVGYRSDLSYFLLAEAAQGLGLADAAAGYYRQALEAGKTNACGRGVFGCEGFDVQTLAAAALARD